MILLMLIYLGTKNLAAHLNRDLHGETLVELLFSRRPNERPGGA
jgi:hypothetical protein